MSPGTVYWKCIRISTFSIKFLTQFGRVDINITAILMFYKNIYSKVINRLNNISMYLLPEGIRTSGSSRERVSSDTRDCTAKSIRAWLLAFDEAESYKMIINNNNNNYLIIFL